SGRARQGRLAAVAGEQRTVVLFESPHRVAATLRDLLEAGGDRRAALCRELTKLHQEVLRGRLSELLARVGEREPRGEVTLVLEGARRPEGDRARALQMASDLVAEGVRKREAARRAAAETGVPASEIDAAL